MTGEASRSPGLAAVVLNWKTASWTISSVSSLLADGVDAAALAIVDNGSNDGSCERFAEELPSVRVLPLESNEGFAAANNRGAALFPDARAYLFVNSDAFVHRAGSVRALGSALERDRVALAVPRLLNPDLSLQRTVVALPTPAVALAQASGVSRVLANRAQPRWGTRWDHACASEIRSATGAVIAVRGAVWRALGGFSERAHLYAEDHDLFWRVRKLGWTAWFTPEAEFVHIGGGTTSTRFSDPERAAAVAAAEAALIRAHLSPLAAATTLRLRQAGHAARLLRDAARLHRGGVDEHLAYVRGFSGGRRRRRGGAS
jgi:GT2 family glycosyltransferase